MIYRSNISVISLVLILAGLFIFGALFLRLLLPLIFWLFVLYTIIALISKAFALLKKLLNKAANCQPELNNNSGKSSDNATIEVDAEIFDE